MNLLCWIEEGELQELFGTSTDNNNNTLKKASTSPKVVVFMKALSWINEILDCGGSLRPAAAAAEAAGVVAWGFWSKLVCVCVTHERGCWGHLSWSQGRGGKKVYGVGGSRYIGPLHICAQWNISKPSNPVNTFPYSHDLIAKLKHMLCNRITILKHTLIKMCISQYGM